MTHNPETGSRPDLNPTSKMSFAVAACAFTAAGFGLLINQWLSGWMAVGGMAGVGLFYLAVGLLNLGSVGSVFTSESELTGTASHRLSDAMNVDNLEVKRPVETVQKTQAENLVAARR